MKTFKLKLKVLCRRLVFLFWTCLLKHSTVQPRTGGAVEDIYLRAIALSGIKLKRISRTSY